jgi:hypothetical protein
MRRLLCVALTFGGLALAETFNGTLVDTMCEKKGHLAEHTRNCAIGCAKSGYGIVLGDGTFLKFNAAGNKKALDALKASTKEKDLKATVSGTRKGDSLDVESVQLD